MRLRPSLSLVAAVVAPLLAVACLVPFREQATSANLALVLVVVIVGVAVTGTRIAAVTAAVVTVLAYDFLLVQPYGSFTIARPDEVVTAVLLLVVGVTVGGLSNWARLQRVRATEREDHLGLLYHFIEQVSVGASDESLIALGEREIAELLEARSCRFEPARSEPTADGRSGAVVDRTGEVYIGDLVWPVAEAGMPSGDVRIPMFSGGLQLGSFIVEPAPALPLPRWRLVMVVMVADLIASALARWPSDA